MANWFVVRNGKAFGPYSDSQLKTLASTKKISPTDLVRREDKPSHFQAGDIKGLFTSPPPSLPPALPPSSPASLAPPPLSTNRPPPLPSSSKHGSSGGQLALWNPSTARWLSIIFGWGFSAFLVAKNWSALGQDDRSRRSMFWFYGCLGFLAFCVFTPNTDMFIKIVRYVGLGCTGAWICFEGIPHLKYVREHVGENYARNSWGPPIGIWVLCVAGVVVVGLSLGL